MNDRVDPVRKGLSDLATDPVETGHFTRTMAQVRTKLKGKSSMNRVIIKSALAGGFAIVAALAMLLIPATYNVQVGTLVKAGFTVPEGLSQQEIVRATTSLGGGRKMLRFDGNGAQMTIATKLTDTNQLQNELRDILQTKFPTISGLEINAEPIVEKHGGNALAAVTGGRIEIGCEGLSDSEIESAIARSLAAHGVNVQQVSVSTTSPAEGQIERRIEIRAECDSTTSCDDMPEIQLDIGDDGRGQQERVIVRDIQP